MAGYNKSTDRLNNIVWKRPATARETLFGLRTDGTIRNICSRVEIHSSVELEQKVLERCAEHFNSDVGCFHEFLMEKKESKDIWLVEVRKSTYLVDELEDDSDIDEITIEDEINGPFRPEEIPNWKLYYNYVTYHESGAVDSMAHPYIYQLIFVFSTGTLDELSCALLCDLFLNILDCALKGVPLHCYSDLKMYDVGSKLESRVNTTIHRMINDVEYTKLSKTAFKMFEVPCSNFDFKKKFVDKYFKFKTLKCFFSQDDSLEFLKLCKRKDVSVYAVIITIINNALLNYALKNGFKGIFRTRVLHIINARCILYREDIKYAYKLGSHFIPYIQNFKLESNDLDEIFKEAPRIERELERVSTRNLYWDHEALRELYIKESGNKYNTGKWNPHYCFSVTNLGTLEAYYQPENPNNSIQLIDYDRATSVIMGGHLDVIFHILNGRLNVHFDFSNEYFSNKEMLTIIRSFKDAVEYFIN